MAHPPTAITYLGSAIWSYKRFSTGAILCVIVPATMIISAWRGLARATSNPKRAKSYRAAPTAINSIPQQLVANVSGHNELLRPQLMRSSKQPTNTFVPLSLSCLTMFSKYSLFLKSS